jgi:hypothetical protein
MVMSAANTGVSCPYELPDDVHRQHAVLPVSEVAEGIELKGGNVDDDGGAVKDGAANAPT